MSALRLSGLATRLGVVARPARFALVPGATRAFCCGPPLEDRQKRIAYRAKMRGWLELDVMLGKFAQKYSPTMTADQCGQFEEVLALENPDLFKWLAGLQEVPSELMENEMMAKLMHYVKNEHKPNAYKFD